MTSEDVTVRLVEAANRAIWAAFEGARNDAGPFPADEWEDEARAAVVAVLEVLATETSLAEDDDVEWPDSGDLSILAQKIKDGSL